MRMLFNIVESFLLRAIGLQADAAAVEDELTKRAERRMAGAVVTNLHKDEWAGADGLVTTPGFENPLLSSTQSEAVSQGKSHALAADTDDMDAEAAAEQEAAELTALVAQEANAPSLSELMIDADGEEDSFPMFEEVEEAAQIAACMEDYMYA